MSKQTVYTKELINTSLWRWLIEVVFAGITISFYFFGCACYLSLMAFFKAFSPLLPDFFFRNKNVTHEEANPTVPPIELSSVASISRKEEVNQEPKKIQPGIIHLFEIPHTGYVFARFYPAEGVVKRTLSLSRKELIEQMGSHRKVLPDMTYSGAIEASIEEVMESTLRDLYIVCKRYFPEMNDAEIVDVQQSYGESKKPESVKVIAHAGHVKPQLKAKTMRAKIDSAVEIVEYVGKVQSYGERSRKLGSKPAFQQFCLDLTTPLGQPERIWGKDLERALELSGAQVGDDIKVAYHGEVPVEVDGQTTSKKIFTVEKL